MAIFTQIGGISTGSITNVLKGPLSALFGGKPKVTQYQYPENLTNDPSRMHFIKFDIYNIVPMSLTSTECSDAHPEGIDAETKLLEGKTLAGKGQMNKALTPERRFTNTSISLFMPESLLMEYNSNWAGAPMPLSFKLVGEGASMLDKGVDWIKNLIGLGDAAIDTASSVGGVAGATEAIGTFAGASPETIGLALKPQGKSVNPQVQMLYHGNEFRDFQFEFLLTAKSKEESDQISAICNAFIYASSPSLDESSLYFIPPSVFNIYLKMAKKSNLSGLSAMLQKAGNSLVPSLSLGSKIGSAMSKGDTSTENTRLFKVGDCVLKGVFVDYAPNGWAAHTNGAPLQTKLTLQFSETEVVHRDRFLSEIR